jgi:hypothetical protein
MQDDQELNLVCIMNGGSYNQLNKELNHCDNVRRVACICILIKFHSNGVQFLSIVGNFLYM